MNVGARFTINYPLCLVTAHRERWQIRVIFSHYCNTLKSTSPECKLTAHSWIVLSSSWRNFNSLPLSFAKFSHFGHYSIVFSFKQFSLTKVNWRNCELTAPISAASRPRQPPLNILTFNIDKPEIKSLPLSQSTFLNKFDPLNPTKYINPQTFWN